MSDCRPIRTIVRAAMALLAVPLLSALIPSAPAAGADKTGREAAAVVSGRGTAAVESGNGKAGGDDHGSADGDSNRADEQRDRALEAFDHLKELQGEWRARSTRGWEETIQFEVTARGSVVVETNRFKDAPDRTMHTMYYIDGDRLMLTHYCEARNQPRLLASEIGEGGQRVVFTFVDGANIPSRTVGHMDKAVFRFIDRDHFTSQWTWYQDGEESWMEEIVHERVR